MGCFSSKYGSPLDKNGQLNRQPAPKAGLIPFKRPPARAGVAAPDSAGFAGPDFAGLFRVTVDSAHLKKKGHYNVTLSMGLQVCLSADVGSFQRILP